MIELHLYGDLGKEQQSSNQHSVACLPAEKASTITQALRQAGVAPERVGQIFVNGQLLHTQCSMAPWLGYQNAQDRLPMDGNYLETPLRDGDRLGVFPTKMAILVV